MNIMGKWKQAQEDLEMQLLYKARIEFYKFYMTYRLVEERLTLEEMHVYICERCCC